SQAVGRVVNDRCGTSKRVGSLVGEPGKERSSIAHADHVPEVVTIDELAVLIDGLGLEDEGARYDEVAIVHGTGPKDLAALLIGHDDVQPRLDVVGGSGRNSTAGLVVSDDALAGDLVPQGNDIRRENLDSRHGPIPPLLGDLRNLDFAA